MYTVLAKMFVGGLREILDIVFHAPQFALEHILTFFLFNLAACDQALIIAHHPWSILAEP